MMLQITNRCRMMCPHCMDSATPDGGLMDEETFVNALKLAVDHGCQHLSVSGGEPSEHPRLLDFCKRINQAHIAFSIMTNGMWLGNAKQEWVFERIAKLRMFCGAQVYSHPKWYRLHDETVRKWTAQQDRWRAQHIELDTEDILNMSDLGRAKTCPEALEETQKSKYRNMCLAAHVMAAQVGSLRELFTVILAQHRFCIPLVDWRGDFHASESWLCQSFGNVNRDSGETLFANLKAGRPCGGCIPCQRYFMDSAPKIVQARKLLGQENVMLGGLK